MYKDIEKLLADLTPEEIYAEAMRIDEAKKAAEEKKAAEAAKKNEEEISATRKTVVDAFCAYTKALVGEEFTDALRKDLEDTLKSYELLIKPFGGKLTKATDKAGSAPTDDETLHKFLKEFGLM